ncbi:MAG TPA: hypothetical protein VEC60_03970 [Reyranella sp.]|nr:hypothetical protein [Reyranella sp.]
MRGLGLAAALLLAACGQSQDQSSREAKANANPAAYARDRDLCRAQANEYMKTRRTIDDSRREVFAGNYERYGQTTLPTDMANYGDSRRTDRLVESCMEARGWSQPQRSWWQR